MSKLDIGLSWVSRITAVVAAAILAAMMLLTVADVAGRYFFDKPVKGTYELIGLMLVGAATWGLGYCQAQDGHIRITVLVERLPQKPRAACNILAYLIGLSATSLICWQVVLMAGTYIFMPHGGLTEILGIPYSPFMIALAIGFGWYGVILLVDLLRSLAEMVRR